MRSNLLAFSASPVSWATSVRLDAAPFIAFIVFAAIDHCVDGLLVALGTYVVLFGIGQPLRARTSTYAVAVVALLVALMLGMTATESSVPPTAVLLFAVPAVGRDRRGGRHGAARALFLRRDRRSWNVARCRALEGRARACDGHWRRCAGDRHRIGRCRGRIERRRQAGGSPVTTARQRMAEFVRWPSGAAVMCARMACALFVVGLASRLLIDPHPFWPVLVVVLILSFPGDRPTLRVRAAQRLLGTLVGIAAFVLIGELALPKWATVALLCGCLYATSRLAARNYLVASIFITVLALELTRILSPSEAVSAMTLARAIETVMAACVAVLSIEAIPARRRDSAC